MNQPGNLIDEADIGSGEQENAERDALQEEIQKIPEDNRPGGTSNPPSGETGSSPASPSDASMQEP